MKSLVSIAVTSVLMLVLMGSSGCSIVMSSKLPLAHPPSQLTPGLDQPSVDKNYGKPTAVGMSADGKEYIEQLQFIDGVGMGWKIFRITLHSVGDTFTYGLWEAIGTPIEILNSKYPEYIYYVVYNDNNRVVRVVPEGSAEGRKIAALGWAVGRQSVESRRKLQPVKRMSLAERSAVKE